MKLEFTKTTTPDFSGFHFYVEEGQAFDLSDYCEAYNLNPDDIDPQSVHWTQDAAAQLMGGEWLEVTHEQ